MVKKLRCRSSSNRTYKNVIHKHFLPLQSKMKKQKEEKIMYCIVIPFKTSKEAVEFSKEIKIPHMISDMDEKYYDNILEGWEKKV